MAQSPDQFTSRIGVKGAAQNWPALMGYLGQELSANILVQMGYTLVVPGLRIVKDVLSVHPDGILAGLDLPKPVLWDSKLRNCYGFKDLLKGPLKQQDAGMYLQMQEGMQATDTERALITVHPHDLSTWKVELSRAKLTLAEPAVHRIWVERDEKAQQLAVDRAQGLLAAKALGKMVRREFNPASNKFPCTYCPYMVACVQADLTDPTGGDMMTVTPIPEEWKNADK
mgnify:CR=1 FL=1